ncbi:hypothetical protein D3C85_1166550 [compost metagenome]
MAGQTGGQGQRWHRNGEAIRVEHGLGDGDQQGGTLAVQGAGEDGSAWGNGGDQTRMQTYGGNGGVTAGPADICGDIEGAAIAVTAAGA